MQISQAGINLIKREEVFRAMAYQDTGGVWTIGYGHTRGVIPGLIIDARRGEELLRDDLKVAESNVNWLVKVPLVQSMYDALVSFEFNTGGLHGSTLLTLLNAHNYLAVPEQLLRWRKDNGKDLLGLTRRRANEAVLYLRDGLPK